jgi:uncharacterized protein involved in exopolysaccharide biosynthesis
VALTIFLLARKRWLNVFLTGLVIVFFLWLGVASAITGAVPHGVAAGGIALAISGFVVKKLRSHRGFLARFITVFLLVFGTSILFTFMLPESFSSTARILIERNQSDTTGMTERPFGGGYDPYLMQTEFEVIQSNVVLGKVIQNFDLRKTWGKKFANGETLPTPETIHLLKARMELRPVRNTSLVEIRVSSDEPQEAARLANGIARAYKEYRENPESVKNVESGISSPRHMRVEIVDWAQPGLRPVRPNRPLNLAIGALAGLLLGTAGAAGVVAYQSGKMRRRAEFT